ncbi:MAG: Gfo/Idh/MocA family oxidoreductase [Candidatus Latescibacteria bacterium]|jgi:predicted dehydrogenase|nr:Gfo/Idh/MocA family oxidoreductase [Candidatus Latescibacterota bacterium]
MHHRIGLVGCGGISRVWVKATGSHPDCEIVLVYDPNEEASAARAEEAGAPVAATYEALLDSSNVDVVIVCTPTFTHRDLVVQAAEAGKHVICEKPMALTIGQCQDMVDACAAANVKLAVGHTIRFWGAFLTTRRLIEEGLIGTPCLGQIHRVGSSRSGQAGTPPPLRSRKPWRFDTRYSGGNILESSVHELDFIRAVFGDVASIYCGISGKEDYDGHISPVMLQALISFENGSSVVFRQGGIVGLPGLVYWVSGTSGALAFDGWDDPVKHHRPGAEEPELFPCSDVLAFELELADLFGAIENDTEPENSGITGLKNIALGLALYRSIETGQPMTFTDGLPDDVDRDYQYRGPNAIKE